MLGSTVLFIENYDLLLESDIPKDPEATKLLTVPSVKRLVDISKKYFTKGLTDNEKKEVQDLLKDDPKVIAFIRLAEKTGVRIGWIYGGGYGAAGGAITGAISAVSLGAPVFALALLGAIIGGLSIGYLSGQVMKILKRWRAEDDIVAGEKTLRVHSI